MLDGSRFLDDVLSALSTGFSNFLQWLRHTHAGSSAGLLMSSPSGFVALDDVAAAPGMRNFSQCSKWDSRNFVAMLINVRRRRSPDESCIHPELKRAIPRN